MAEDLSSLPALWANGNDFILVPDKGKRLCLARSVNYVTTEMLSPGFWENIGSIEPWGWDSLLVAMLKRANCPTPLLPSENELSEWRKLSNRALCSQMLPFLIDGSPRFIGESVVCNDVPQIERFLELHGDIMLKAPWSGSGRGVFRCSRHNKETALPRAANVIGKQGAIEAEPFYERIQDFAMEFTAKSDGSVSYDGLSVFATNSAGAYGGNLLGNEEKLFFFLSPWISSCELSLLKENCVKALSALVARKYSGRLGIDMMVVRHNGKTKIHPCVEVNLRNTMGRVAICASKVFSSYSRSMVCPLKSLPENSQQLTLGARSFSFALLQGNAMGGR